MGCRGLAWFLAEGSLYGVTRRRDAALHAVTDANDCRRHSASQVSRSPNAALRNRGVQCCLGLEVTNLLLSA